MDAAIIFSYTRAAPGRESEALQAFTEATGYFGQLAQEGKTGAPIHFMGTSGQNHLIIPGIRNQLFDVTETDEFRDIYLRAIFAVPDIHYEFGYFGDGVVDEMARWAKVGGELALM
jgi:hypothetical protein